MASACNWPKEGLRNQRVARSKNCEFLTTVIVGGRDHIASMQPLLNHLKSDLDKLESSQPSHTIEVQCGDTTPTTLSVPEMVKVDITDGISP